MWAFLWQFFASTKLEPKLVDFCGSSSETNAVKGSGQN